MPDQNSLLIALSFVAGLMISGLVALLLTKSNRQRPDAILQQIQQRVEGLSNIFSVPRYRGQAGEWMLEQMLQDCLPPHAYHIQHSFRNGSRADALLKLGDITVAVDAKFPLESLNDWREGPISEKSRKAVLGHAQSIASKYILPEEGTLHFALMYIPSEAIYTRLFAENPGKLMQDCLRAGIVPSSPSNLFLYLQTIAYGLRGMDFSHNFNKYANLFELIRQDSRQLQSSLQTGGGHLRNLQKTYSGLQQQADALTEHLETTAIS